MGGGGGGGWVDVPHKSDGGAPKINSLWSRVTRKEKPRVSGGISCSRAVSSPPSLLHWSHPSGSDRSPVSEGIKWPILFYFVNYLINVPSIKTKTLRKYG